MATPEGTPGGPQDLEQRLRTAFGELGRNGAGARAGAGAGPGGADLAGAVVAEARRRRRRRMEAAGGVAIVAVAAAVSLTLGLGGGGRPVVTAAPPAPAPTSHRADSSQARQPDSQGAMAPSVSGTATGAAAAAPAGSPADLAPPGSVQASVGCAEITIDAGRPSCGGTFWSGTGERNAPDYGTARPGPEAPVQIRVGQTIRVSLPSGTLTTYSAPTASSAGGRLAVVARRSHRSGSAGSAGSSGSAGSGGGATASFRALRPGVVRITAVGSCRSTGSTTCAGAAVGWSITVDVVR